MAITVWHELRDVSGKPADGIPELLDAMKKGRSEERRQAAEGEFWCQINSLGMLCTATAPGIDAYLAIVEAGKIPLTQGLAFTLTDLLANVSVKEKSESKKTASIKADVRAAIHKRKKFFAQVFKSGPDVNVRSEVADLLAQLGDPKPKRSVVAPLVRKLLAHKADPEQWSLLVSLDYRSEEIKDWERHLKKILAGGADILRFHAACYLMKFSEGNPSPEVVAALKELPKLANDGSFRTCTEAFCKAGVSLRMDILLDIVESVLAGVTEASDPNSVCRDLLIAVFQPRLPSIRGFEMDPGIDEIELLWKPKKPYPFARKLAPEHRHRLCGILASCDALWIDRTRNLNRRVKTNLWSLFRLPVDRESMRAAGR